MTKKLADKVALLEAKLKKEKAALAAAESKRRTAMSRKRRADDTRRKILLGSILLKKVEAGTFKREAFDQLVDHELARDDDRALFGLAPRRPPSAAPASE